MLIACLIYLFLGLIGGVLLSKMRTDVVGTLRIDNSDPDDGPYLFLEMTTNPNNIKKHKYVTMKVDARNYISPK